MKKLFYIGLCVILTFVCTGCSPQESNNSHPQESPQKPYTDQASGDIPLPDTAKERFDPAGLMTPETFEMNKRCSGQIASPERKLYQSRIKAYRDAVAFTLPELKACSPVQLAYILGSRWNLDLFCKLLSAKRKF